MADLDPEKQRLRMPWPWGVAIALALFGAGGAWALIPYRLSAVEDRTAKVEAAVEARKTDNQAQALRLERIETKLDALVNTVGEVKQDLRELTGGAIRPARGGR